MNNILFVFEGEKPENHLIENLKKNNFIQENTYITCVYGTVIYKLYQEISQDEDLDLFVLLKQNPLNSEPLANFHRNDFAEIYLFFDYDGHTSNADDEKLKKMLLLFQDETDLGKLFISYPMVEALKHFSKTINFQTLKVNAKDNIKYKQKVNAECDKEFINIVWFEKNHWIQLIDIHLKKMNYIVTDNFCLPQKHIPQKEIFTHQLEKYIKIDNSVAILSAFPIFLFDYYGFDYIEKLLTF